MTLRYTLLQRLPANKQILFELWQSQMLAGVHANGGVIQTNCLEIQHSVMSKFSTGVLFVLVKLLAIVENVKR